MKLRGTSPSQLRWQNVTIRFLATQYFNQVTISAFKILPWVACFILVAITLKTALHPPAEVQLSIPKGLTEEQRKELRDFFLAENIERQKEDVKRYLEWIIGIAGFFTIAQTVAAAFASQSFARQAERDVKELDDFKEKYEDVRRAGEAQNAAFDILKSLYSEKTAAIPSRVGSTERFGWFDWRKDLYGSMNVADRQLILSADRYLGYDLMLSSQRGRGALKTGFIRMLANFYASKYDHERKVGIGQLQDLERANHLLRYLNAQELGDFAIYNDLALIHVRYAIFFGDSLPAESLQAHLIAAEYLDRSAILNPDQQRSYYGRASIAKRVEGNAQGLLKAVALLTIARSKKNWEYEPNSKMATDLLYNLACYKAKLFALGWDTPTVLQPLEIPTKTEILCLLAAISAQKTVSVETVDNDFRIDGDFFRFEQLLSGPDLAQLQQIKTELMTPGSSPSPKICFF